MAADCLGRWTGQAGMARDSDAGTARSLTRTDPSDRAVTHNHESLNRSFYGLSEQRHQKCMGNGINVGQDLAVQTCRRTVSMAIIKVLFDT
jgi:hypothetical protein